MGLLDARREIASRPAQTYAGQAAEELRSLMRRYGITNRQLAQACERSEFWVGKRINGQVPIDLDDLELFARARRRASRAAAARMGEAVASAGRRW